MKALCRCPFIRYLLKPTTSLRKSLELTPQLRTVEGRRGRCEVSMSLSHFVFYLLPSVSTVQSPAPHDTVAWYLLHVSGHCVRSRNQRELNFIWRHKDLDLDREQSWNHPRTGADDYLLLIFFLEPFYLQNIKEPDGPDSRDHQSRAVLVL